MEKRKVLGRGLDTLLPAARSAAPAAGTAVAPTPTPAGDIVHHIAVELIDRNPYQTRMQVEDTKIDELAASIKASGVLQPITVRSLPEGRYQLITGERRWLASQSAGKTTVPAIIRQVSNEQAMEMTIVENLQREDLNPMEQAWAFERLSKEFSLTQEQIAIRTGKERTTVANFLRLLKLPEDVQGLIQHDKLTVGHAKALMALNTASGISQMAQRIEEKAMSVRQTEEYINKLLYPPAQEPPPRRVPDANVREAAEGLQRILGVKVQILDRGGKGKIILEYESLDDFDRIVDSLGPK